MSILRSVNSGRNRIVKSYTFKWTGPDSYAPYDKPINASAFRPLNK